MASSSRRVASDTTDRAYTGRVKALGIALVVVLACGVGHAGPRTPAQAAAARAYAEGQARYDAKDYLGAANRFAEAYSHDPDPVYLFNLAQAYRFAKRCRDAADGYRRFLAAAPDAPNKDKVEHYVAEMDACARTQGEPTAATDTDQAGTPAVPAPDGSGATTAPPRDDATAGVTSLHVAGQAEPEAHDGLRTLGYVAGGVGIAALGLGGYFTWDISRITHDRDRACPAATICDGGVLEHFDDRGHRAEIGEAMAYSIGGALLVAGVALVVLGHHRHAIALAPERDGVVAVGAFTF